MPRALITTTGQTIRNQIINGNFDFWQRGVTLTSVSGGNYGPDRWRYHKFGNGSDSIVRSTDVPTLAQSGWLSNYSMSLTVGISTTIFSPSHFNAMNYRIEGNDYGPYHRGFILVSFWIKSSLTGTVGVALQNSDSTRSYVTTVTINTANTWERKIVPVTLDTSGTWLSDTGIGLQLFIVRATGAAAQTATTGVWQTGNFLTTSAQTNYLDNTATTFFLAQVMIVPLAQLFLIAPTFQRACSTIGQELSACQRYFEKSFPLETAPANGIGDIRPGYGIEFRRIPFAVMKRSIPTMAGFSSLSTTAGQWHYFNGAWVTFGVNFAGTDQASFSASGQVTATVAGQWTADAEL